jgi:predicted RNA-binding protein YlqC (UPF0109 family)
MVQELIKHIVLSLVEHKEGVRVVQEEGIHDQLLFKVTVDNRDLGRVIGREGQTIKAIKALVTVVNPEQKSVSIDICE